MINYSILDKDVYIRKSFNFIGKHNFDKYEISFYQNTNTVEEYSNIYGVLYKDGKYLMEENTICYDLSKGKKYLIDLLKKRLYFIENFNEKLSFIHSGTGLKFKTNLDYHNFYLFEQGENLNELKSQLLQNKINEIDTNVVFNTYNAIKIEDKKLKGLLEEYKKHGIQFFFFDRCDVYRLPVIECIMINRNWFSLLNFNVDIDKHIVKRYFYCHTDYKKCIEMAINNTFYGKTHLINLLSIKNFEITTSNLNLPLYEHVSKYIEETPIYLCEKKQNNTNMYIGTLDSSEILFENYEDYIKRNLEENTNFFSNKELIPFFLKHNLSKNANLETAQNYLYITNLIIHRDKHKEELKNIRFSLRDEDLPVLFFERKTTNSCIAALNFIASYLAIDTELKQIWNWVNELFEDKEMLNIIKEIVENKRDIFDNKYIFD